MWQWVARGNIQQISYIPQTEQHLPFGLMLLCLGNVITMTIVYTRKMVSAKIEDGASKTDSYYKNQKVNISKCSFIMKYIVNETHVHKGMTIHIYFSSFTSTYFKMPPILLHK